MGATSHGEGAARWMTLGVLFVSTPNYGDALHQAQKEFNSNPEDVLSTIEKQLPEIRQDPFIFQMAMNLVYQLNLDSEKKGQLFGSEMEYQLAHLEPNPSDTFWVSVNSLTLAQQAGVKSSDLEPYLQRGLKNSKGSPQLLEEFKVSIRSFFPSLSI